MTDECELRRRLVGRRFYDRERDESFTVVGITSDDHLALLQYEDGRGGDEGAAKDAVGDSFAYDASLDPEGLDSPTYRPLGPGPRIENVCDPAAHEWFPRPDDVWPEGPSSAAGSDPSLDARDLYERFVRCTRCGLSGAVAAEFGMYGGDPGDHHAPPWFCAECGRVTDAADLSYREGRAYCRSCGGARDGSVEAE